METDEQLIAKVSETAESEIGAKFSGSFGTELKAALGQKLESWRTETAKQLEKNFPLKEEFRSFFNSSRDFSRGISVRGLLLQDISAYSKISPGDSPKFLSDLDRLLDAGLADLHRRLLEAWSADLEKLRLDWIGSALEKRRSRLVDSLEKWLSLVESSKNLGYAMGLRPGILWDLGAGPMFEHDVETLNGWANSFRNDPNLRRICEMLGRSLFIRRDGSEREVPLKDIGLMEDRSVPEEISGIELGNRVEDMLPSESVLLTDPDTEPIFDLKYAENRLLCFSKQGYVSIESENISDVSTESDDEMSGPIIFCIDTSGSMSGTPEYIAKGAALYVAMRAVSEKRNCYLINFSCDTSSVDISPPKGLEELTSFLRTSFHGGTDVVPAMREAVSVLSDREYSKADVILISDLVVPPDAFLPVQGDIIDSKGRGCRFHCLTIGNFVFAPDVSDIFDMEWAYDPSVGKVSEKAHEG